MIIDRYVFTKPLLFSLWLLSWAIPSGVVAGDCEEKVAKLVSAQGLVEVRSPVGNKWKPVQLDNEFCPGDRLRLGANSRAGVYLSNDSFLRLDELSSVVFSAPAEAGSSWLDLAAGIAHFISRVRQSFQVNTPYVNASVEGTEFVVSVEENHTNVTVLEGVVLARNLEGELRLSSGESARTSNGQAPIKLLIARPLDTVQWALYYPPITDPDSPAILDDIAQAQRLLIVGRVTETRKLVAAIRQRSPESGDALAIASIIELVQNNKAAALDLAKQAVTNSESSATALLALSFAEQAHFDLVAARNSVERAILSEPQNALAWARLAELSASLGDYDRSLEAAERAVELNPELSRTQSVLGFSYLTQLKVEDAQKVFIRAIELDSADPLARLGLGLAKIKAGHLADGRREIEIALSLDPGNSLIRSYLGKAYYEEDRNKVAGIELAQAKLLDPLDPTPWLYDAIRKQSENKPVEAIHDLEKSVELNDNRAVYRSRLLLDEDSATRSAGLGSIYSSLHMEPLAMLEAAKSLHANPLDSSAHRLLTDVYSGLNRQETFKSSALLKTLLFQPKNIRPLSPEDTANSLGLLDGLGPTSPSFHEWGSLFDMDGHSVVLKGEVGNQDAAAHETIVYGSMDEFSYSAGYAHRQTDGFRDNSDQDHKIGELFAQWSVNPEVGIQFEYRKRETERGDIQLRGDVDDFFPNDRHAQDAQYLRTGLVYENSIKSTNILSINHHILDTQTVIEDFITLENNLKTKSLLIEAQNVWRSEGFRWVSGIGSLDQETKRETIVSFGFPLSPDVSASESTAEFYNVYGYLYSDVNSQIKTVVGVSYDKGRDEVNGNEVRFNRFNPKVGVIWMPTNSLSLTSSLIHMNVRPLLIDTGTIEPTLFGRFSAHRDTERNTGISLQQYALGADQKLNENLSLGVSSIWRKMEVPFFTGEFEDQEEDIQHAYVYWNTDTNVSFTTDITREVFDREIQTASIPNRVETIKGRFGTGYWYRKLSTGLSATYVDQEVRTGSESTGDSFWLVDLDVGYKLTRSNELGCVVKNLADKDFDFVDNSFRIPQEAVMTPEFLPGRTVACRIKLVF